MKIVLTALLLAACVHLPHVDPQARTPDDAARADVLLDVTCSTPNPFVSDDPADPRRFDPGVDWYPERSGHGVVVSERHIVTVAHLVTCPTIPYVVATFSDGRRFHVDVIRDDITFGDGTDYARLESASAENFGLGIAPPQLGHFVPGDPAVAMTRQKPGGLMFEKDIVRGMTTVHGDSGAGVYDIYGLLVGLVSKGATDGSYTRIVLARPDWLAGT
jgi:hypothetical protein